MAILNKNTFYNESNLSHILESGFNIHSSNPVRIDYANFDKGKIAYYIPKGSTTNEGFTIHMEYLNKFSIQEVIIKEDQGNKRTKYWVNTTWDREGRCPFHIRNHSKSMLILTDSTCITGDIILENVVVSMGRLDVEIGRGGKVIFNNTGRLFLYDLNSILHEVKNIDFGKRGGITFSPRIGDQWFLLEQFNKNEEFHDIIRKQFPSLSRLNLVCEYGERSYATLIFDLNNPNNSHINICPYLNQHQPEII